MEKFNKDTIQTFDKVLVRFSDGFKWEPKLFGRWCVDENYIPYAKVVEESLTMNYQVVPFNEETKHLAYTKEKAPDKYNFWDEQTLFGNSI